jgi:hypothetical protein
METFVRTGSIRRIAAIAALAALPMLMGSARAVCLNPAGDQPETCSPASSCGVTGDGHFEVAFLGSIFDGTNTTFTYQLCERIASPNLSHWVLGLDCPTFCTGGTLVVPDPTTCLDGRKFETPSGVADCANPVCGDDGTQFQIVCPGNVPLRTAPMGLTVATKAGNLAIGTFCVEGPSCSSAPTTTTTTTTTATTTTHGETTTTMAGETTTTTAVTTTTVTTACVCSDDGNPCTDDVCLNGQCTHVTRPGCCVLNTDCPDSVCHEGVCIGNRCEQVPIEGCCVPEARSNGDCDDGNVCTTDDCDPATNLCRSVPVEGCCLTDGECDDLNQCTVDTCVANACAHAPLTNPPEEICNNSLDDDCDGLIDCKDYSSTCVDAGRPCIKNDPSSIRFGPPGLGLDQFRSHGRVTPALPVDPLSEEVGWFLTNEDGFVYRGALIAGDLKGGRSFTFRDRGARSGAGKRFGIYKAKIIVGSRGTVYYKVMAYGDLSKATDAHMAVHFYIGDQAWGFDTYWNRTASGWIAPPLL